MIQLTDNLTISTIRSGKGDCVHICFIGSSGQPHNIIVDSGPTSSAGEFRNLLTSIIRSGETLDALIITHYDDDHIGGILMMIKHERTITDDLVDKWREALATPVARKRIKDGKRSIKPWLDFCLLSLKNTSF